MPTQRTVSAPLDERQGHRTVSAPLDERQPARTVSLRQAQDTAAPLDEQPSSMNKTHTSKTTPLS